MMTEQQQSLEDIDNVAVSDYKTTQAAEQVNDLTRVANAEEIIIDDCEQFFKKKLLSNPILSQKLK